MKNIITGIIILIFIANLRVNAQDKVLTKDTEWLEKQLNALALESKTDEKVKQFSFNNCHCEFKAQDKKGSGFNFNMNYTFDLHEISSVTYAANDEKSYDLIIKLKTEEVAKALRFNSFSTTLYTTDENKMKEIIKTFKSSIKICSTGN